MTPELWRAKKIIDSTLHPGTFFSTYEQVVFERAVLKFSIDTGKPVLLPFRMSCFVFSNLVVTAGMLQPNLSVSQLESLILHPCLSTLDWSTTSLYPLY